ETGGARFDEAGFGRCESRTRVRSIHRYNQNTDNNARCKKDRFMQTNNTETGAPMMRHYWIIAYPATAYRLQGKWCAYSELPHSGTKEVPSALLKGRCPDKRATIPAA